MWRLPKDHGAGPGSGGQGWLYHAGSSAWQTPSTEAPLQIKQPELELWARGMTQW